MLSDKKSLGHQKPPSLRRHSLTLPWFTNFFHPTLQTTQGDKTVQKDMLHHGTCLPSHVHIFPLCVSFVAESITLSIPWTLSSVVISAFSKPKALAPRLPMSVWTQLLEVSRGLSQKLIQIAKTHPGSIGNAVISGSSSEIFLVR